ncbi:hypothetical protein L2U69_05055 [Zavarzinia compransoris]|uniref:hypothetical protein n=1 Tax=Zavarzinia marina TaxID=2911065 RepID=UPI001F28A2F4|nr:hypothetical protein [Zavarzinia marina]MCF4165006.1 hypothetical protein [Zavarzinia marina]
MRRSSRTRAWRTWGGAVVAALWIAVFGMGGPARASGDFDIGIVPGDVVLGNIVHFPGHAGIYIGRWEELPADIQADFADVYDAVLIRSRDYGLADSHLVVDAIGGRGTTLRSFTEQFTGYLPNGAQAGKLPASLHWEAKTGGAIAWPGLGTDDPRRWAIVREALEAARANVPYEGSHFQLETTNFSSVERRVEWIDGIKNSEAAALPYDQIESGFDCITLVHVVYWRAAQIDLDVSFKFWHTPEQLHEEAKAKGYYRAVLFEDLFLDAALLGKWKLKLTLEEMWEEGGMTLPPEAEIWTRRLPGVGIAIGFAKPGEGKPEKFIPLPGELRHEDDDRVSFESVNMAGDRPGRYVVRFEVGPDGALVGTYSGIDPPDSAGEGGGAFRIALEGIKLRDMKVPPKRR